MEPTQDLVRNELMLAEAPPAKGAVHSASGQQNLLERSAIFGWIESHG